MNNNNNNNNPGERPSPESSRSPSSPERPGLSSPSELTKQRRRRPSPGTPTPSRRVSQQPPRPKASISKPRAVSTSALAALRAAESHSLLPGTFSPLISVSAGDERDPTRSDRGASEPLRTPDQPATKTLSASHSAPVVTTRSTLKRQRVKAQVVSNQLADQLLAKEIRAKTFVPCDDDAKTGTNYVLDMHHKNDPEDNFVKIGETRDHGDARRKKIHWTCGHPGYNVPIPGQVPSRYWKKIEKLTLAELLPHKHAMDCDCGQIHREYVKLPVDLAVEATQRWTQFCESQPWDSRGRLHPFWEARLSDLQASKKLDKATRGDRAVLWTEFADAGSLPFWRYNAQILGRCIADQYQLCMLIVLIAVLNTVIGPNWCLLYLNLGCQFWVSALYTFGHVNLAWNHARKASTDVVRPKHIAVPLPQTPGPIHESETECESLSSDESDEETTPLAAVRGGSIPGSSAQNPIDLSSDVEIEE